MQEKQVNKELQEKFEPIKLEYTPPELQEHGNVEDVTLQTFFGTFSPPAGAGS